MQFVLLQRTFVQRLRELPVVIHFPIHVAIAMVGSMIVGFAPEALLGQMYYGSYIEPYSPFIAAAGAILGYFINRNLGQRAACWVWMVGVLWLALGAYDAFRGWNLAWDGPSRIAYIYTSFFAPSSKCSQECLGEFLFTTPTSATITYSLGALFGLRSFRANRAKMTAAATSNV